MFNQSNRKDAKGAEVFQQSALRHLKSLRSVSALLNTSLRLCGSFSAIPE
jgi:hypothetical protein